MKRYISIITLISCTFCNAGLRITNHTCKEAIIAYFTRDYDKPYMRALTPGESEELDNPQSIIDLQYYIPLLSTEASTHDTADMPYINKQNIAGSTYAIKTINNATLRNFPRKSKCTVMLIEQQQKPHNLYTHVITGIDKNGKPVHIHE